MESLHVTVRNSFIFKYSIRFSCEREGKRERESDGGWGGGGVNVVGLWEGGLKIGV